MAQMTSALFDNREDARRAVHALRDHGVDEKEISVLAMADDGSGKISNLDASERVDAPGKDDGISTTTPGDAEKGAAEGAAIGAGLGLAAALASIFVPGFGFVTAGGALATAIGGAVAAAVGGAVTGGVAGYLADMGVPEHAAHRYSEGIKKGGVLVSVHETDSATPEEIQQIFTKYNGHSAGSYSGITPIDINASNPDALDAENRRLDTADRSADRSGSSTNAPDLKTEDRADDSLQEDPMVKAFSRDKPKVEVTVVSGDAASSRVNDARLGPNPDHLGASTSSLSVPTATPRSSLSDVGPTPGATAGAVSSPASPTPVLVDEEDEDPIV